VRTPCGRRTAQVAIQEQGTLPSSANTMARFAPTSDLPSLASVLVTIQPPALRPADAGRGWRAGARNASDGSECGSSPRRARGHGVAGLDPRDQGQDRQAQRLLDLLGPTQAVVNGVRGKRQSDAQQQSQQDAAGDAALPGGATRSAARLAASTSRILLICRSPAIFVSSCATAWRRRSAGPRRRCASAPCT